MRFLMPLAPFAVTLQEGARRLVDVAVGSGASTSLTNASGESASVTSALGKGQDQAVEKTTAAASFNFGSGR